MSAQNSEETESVEQGYALYRPVELDTDTSPMPINAAVPPRDEIKLESMKDLLSSKESSQDELRVAAVNKLSKTKSNEEAHFSDSIVLMNLQTAKPVPGLPQPDIPSSAFEVLPKPDIEKEEEKSIIKEIYEEDTGSRLLDERTEARRSRWSDDVEASGLPRSESQIFRFTQAMRTLFCCGVAYERASEDEQYEVRGGFPM